MLMNCFPICLAYTTVVCCELLAPVEALLSVTGLLLRLLRTRSPLLSYATKVVRKLHQCLVAAATARACHLRQRVVDDFTAWPARTLSRKQQS